MKLTDTLLLAAAIGSFLLWILEISRGASFADGYWLLLATLGFLLAFQYVRIKRRQDKGEISPTVKQMAADRAEKQKKKTAKKRS